MTTINSTDPIGIALDASGDVAMGPRGFAFTYGSQAVAQGILVRLKNIKGEWFLDLENGVPWFTSILGAKYNEMEVRGIILDTITKAPGVTELISLVMTFNASTRSLDIAFETRTVFGDTVSATLTV